MTAAPVPTADDRRRGPASRPFTVSGLILLDPLGHDPTAVESLVFDDDGIGVVRTRGEDPRVLPWESVVTHAVESWAGGVIPEWWVDPEAQRPDRAPETPVDAMGALLAEQAAPSRALPHAEAGALISIQTRTGTYRFLRSGADPADLATHIGEFAVRHQGPAGVSTVTTVATGRHRHGRGADRSTWTRIQPWLVALLIVILIGAVTAILLQSAGVIHLPILGGTPAGSAVPLLSRR